MAVPSTELFDIMAAYFCKTNLIFGSGNAPDLPVGWQLHESEYDWMKATDATGQIYFISPDFAYPQRVAGKGMMLEEGEKYIDLENGVSLSNAQADS